MSDIIMLILNAISRIIMIIGRFIFKNVIYGEKGERVPPIKNPILFESAVSLAAKIRTGKLKSVDVMKAFIERVKEVNPLLNCIIDERYAEALKEAEEVDKFIASGVMKTQDMEREKPFLGVPFSTKDSIYVKGLVNSSGFYHRRNVIAQEDAPPIAKMKKAGAIIFCLTNVPELCLWYESNNVVYGKTNNPYDTFRTVGGSSGGEGAIQAASASPFGVGSDIGGSIRIPSNFNGIFGHKPTKSIVSNEKMFPKLTTPEEEHMLGVGPMSRFAGDLLPMLKILVKDDKLPLLKLDEPVDVRNLKVYYQENDLGSDFVAPVDKDIQVALRKVANYFKNDLQVDTKEVKIQRIKNLSPVWMAMMKAPGYTPMTLMLSEDGNKKINPKVELFKMLFGKSHYTFISMMTSMKQVKEAEPGSEEQKRLFDERDKLIDEFKKMLGDDGVFLYPTHPCVAPYHYETIIRPYNITYTTLVNVLGMPSCNVPLGIGREGLPLGIQVVANYHNDRLCLAVARELEKAFGGWVNPNP